LDDGRNDIFVAAALREKCFLFRGNNGRLRLVAVARLWERLA